MKTNISVLFICLFLTATETAFAKKTDGSVWRDKKYVKSPYDLPRFWKFYGGETSNFTKQMFNAIVNGKDSISFLSDVIQINPGNTVVYKLKGGLLIVAEDRYYYTLDNQNEIVSIFIEGEENGNLPDYSDVSRGVDRLCFFKGKLANKCAYGDDT